jgi:hypothetical protein
MYRYIQNIEARMSADQRDMLRRIWAPTVVATPLGDSRRNVCVLPDGEIRSYGRLYAKNDEDTSAQNAYLSSTDGGLSWTKHYAHGKMNACTYFPTPAIYVTSCDCHNNNQGLGEGLWVMRSAIGPDDPDPEIIKVADGSYGDTFLPKQSDFSNRIWFTSQYTADYNTRLATFFYSDDWGKTWQRRELPPVKPLPVEYPHKGPRWSIASGTEPYVTELSEGEMLSLLSSIRLALSVKSTAPEGLMKIEDVNFLYTEGLNGSLCASGDQKCASSDELDALRAAFFRKYISAKVTV